MTVVSAATTSRTNVTELLIISLGSRLTNAEPMAGITTLGSSIAEAFTCCCNFMASMDVTPKCVRSEQGAGIHREVLDDGSERQRREEGEAADDQDHADDQADEQPTRRRQRAGRRRNG